MEQNTLTQHKTSLLQTVPVYRMEKMISDMSKYKQLIKQLIVFVPQEEEISLKLTFTETVIYFFSRCVGFG